MIFQHAEKSRRLKGIPVSPGIIIGKARLVDRSKVKLYYQYLIRDEQVSKEADRFREALNITREQVVALKARMQDQIQSHAFILDAQLMILDDSMLSEATVNTVINEKINAEWALQKSVQTIRQLFEQIDDDYIK